MIRESREDFSRADLSRFHLPRRAKDNKLKLALKEKCRDFLGGSCECCGYKGVALEFHHKDPAQKRFGISQAIYALMAWDQLVVELRKCQLLCANHHKEVHANVPPTSI